MSHISGSLYAPFVALFEKDSADRPVKASLANGSDQLFGFACDRIASIRGRLVDPTRFGLPWRKLLTWNFGDAGSRSTRAPLRAAGLSPRCCIYRLP